MKNHFHVIWQILPPFGLSQVRQNLLKYTAHQFKFVLLDDRKDIVGDNSNNGEKNKKLLRKFKVNKIDREYQFWKRKPLSVQILTEKILLQKIL